MSELRIQESINVNEVENVVKAIFQRSGRRVNDPELIRRFIVREKATQFYLDEKMNSCTVVQPESRYLLLDTGYCTEKGQPLMILLNRSMNGFIGHITGTTSELKDRLKSYHPENAGTIERNYAKFLEKYKKRAAERKNAEIGDEQSYILGDVNDEVYENEFARQFRLLNLHFEQEEAEDAMDAGINDDADDAESTEALSIVEEEISEEEQELTIGLLVDKIEELEAFNAELLGIIEKTKAESGEALRKLQEKNEEYVQVIRQMREFADEEGQSAKQSEVSCGRGHALIGKRKLLVLGAVDIEEAVMLAIAKKEFGFEKSDIEFETDYQKVNGFTKRIDGGARYRAVILGKVPHKVSNLGCWSSIVQKLKNSGACDFAVDARVGSGDLKVTKTSFREALKKVCAALAEQEAC